MNAITRVLWLSLPYAPVGPELILVCLTGILLRTNKAGQSLGVAVSQSNIPTFNAKRRDNHIAGSEYLDVCEEFDFTM